MKHDNPLAELAPMYLLGLLEPAQAQEFEARLAAGDAELLAALAGDRETTASLAWAVEVAPSPDLKNRLFRRLNKRPAKGLGSVLTTEGVWRESAPGVKFKILYHDRHADLLTTLVKMEPGAKIPAHMHSRAEQCLIVEGDLRQGGLVYGPGDFTYAEGGSVDEEISTVHGNVLLIIAPPEKGEIRL